jgi:hypothetical protein
MLSEWIKLLTEDGKDPGVFPNVSCRKSSEVGRLNDLLTLNTGIFYGSNTTLYC